MKKPTKLFRNILRGLSLVAVILYILFLVFEGVPLDPTGSFADLSVYLLFLVFLLGCLFLWKDEFVSGLILIAWYGIQWCLVLWVWVDGGMTLILGLPIAILGVLALIYGIAKKRTGENPD